MKDVDIVGKFDGSVSRMKFQVASTTFAGFWCRIASVTNRISIL